MALLDFLKNKDQNEKSKQPAKKAKEASVAKKSTAKPVKTEVKKEATPSTSGKAKTAKGFSYEAVQQPHISEKATILGEMNQYVFEVAERSNKKEIAKSVEGIYGVNVVSVNIIKVPPKKRRLGKTQGFKKSYVKAIVKIQDGQKIEIL